MSTNPVCCSPPPLDIIRLGGAIVHGTCTALCLDGLRGGTGRLTVVCQDIAKVGETSAGEVCVRLAARESVASRLARRFVAR